MHFIWTIIIGFIAGVIAKFGGSGLCGIPPHGTAVKPTNLSDGGELIPDARRLRPGPPQS